MLAQLHKSLQAAAPQITRQSDAKELRFVLKAVRCVTSSSTWGARILACIQRFRL
jgi:hypothetical protein